MNVLKKTISIICILILVGCSITQKQKQGNVLPNNFKYETKFETAKGIIVLPFQLNGVEKNFLFDTGADLTLIQRNTTKGKTSSFSGASNRKVKLGNETIPSMKIGTVDFKNTFALNGDFSGLKEQVPNFGGLIGQSIINKANWLIDYPNKTIEISNHNLIDSSYQNIKIKREGGAPYTYITIDGIHQKVVIDFGSSSDFNLPKESKLAQQLLKTYTFKDHKRERYTLGGLQYINEKVGVIPEIKLGNTIFKNVKTTINTSSQPRIGIDFFKRCKVYIDNSNNSYSIKKVN